MRTKTRTDGNRDDEPDVVWERQSKETDRQYRAFRVYRNLGDDRSLRQVAAVLGHQSTSHLERWSAQNDWPARAAAYDEYLDREQRAEQRRNLEAMTRHEMRLIEFLRSLAVRRIIGWDGGGDPSRAVTPLDPNKLSARDVAALLREGTRMAARRPERRNWLREAALRDQMLTSSEFIQALRDITELAMAHIPDERKPFFAEEIRAWADGDLKP
jgi:hypothetical protein